MSEPALKPSAGTDEGSRPMNPFLSEEAPRLFDNDDDYTLEYEEGSGEAVMRRIPSEPEGEPQPEEKARQLIDDSEDLEKSLEARLRGLQSKVTPTFQELAEAKRELKELKEWKASVEGRTNETNASQELSELISSSVKAALGEDSIVEPDSLARALTSVLPRALETYTQKTLGGRFEEINKLKEELSAQREINSIQMEYGPKLPIMTRVLQMNLEQDPTLKDRFTPRQLLQMAHSQLEQLAKQEMEKKKAEEASQGGNKIDATEARRRAESLVSESGVAPTGTPAQAGELPTRRPMTEEDAIYAAMKQEGWA